MVTFEDRRTLGEWRRVLSEVSHQPGALERTGGSSAKPLGQLLHCWATAL